MGCTRYSPLVSRFLDDDLEKEELNGFLDHLLQCEECQKEMKAFESLQSCFRAAESLDPAPEPRKAFVLADLPLDAKTEPGAVPVTLLGQEAFREGAEAGGKANRSRESSWLGNLSRYISRLGIE